VRRATDPWSLPAARQFLTEVEPLIWRGGAVISSDASTPPKLAERLVSHLRDVATVERLTPAPGALPLAILSDAFGQAGASIAAIVASGRCFLIEAQDLPAADLPGWTRVLADFVAKSASSDEGGAMLFLGEAEVPPGLLAALIAPGHPALRFEIQELGLGLALDAPSALLLGVAALLPTTATVAVSHASKESLLCFFLLNGCVSRVQ
jgi:hypothetical protein